jgi:hypothetical protein
LQLFSSEIGIVFFPFYFSLLLAAHKYNIHQLVDLCQAELSKRLEVENAIDLLKVADQVGANHLKLSSIAFIAEHLVVYYSTASFSFSAIGLKNRIYFVEISKYSKKLKI